SSISSALLAACFAMPVHRGFNSKLHKRFRLSSRQPSALALKVRPVRWSDRLRWLISRAHSSIGLHAEQSERKTKTARTIEITVETDEVVLERTANTSFAEYTLNKTEGGLASEQ